MTILSTDLYNTWQNETQTQVEVEYFISDLYAITEYELLAIGISVWFFMRLYYFGICRIARSVGYELD